MPAHTAYHGNTRGVLLVMLYIAVAITPIIFAAVFGYTYGHLVYEMGRSFAILGFMLIVLQVFLAGRIKWIEQPYGFDILIRFHRNMGIFALLLILSHPILLAAGSGNWALLTGLAVPPVVWLGRATLAVLIASVLISVYQRPLGLTFEHWRLIHDILSPLVIAGAFVHSFVIGADLNLVLMQGIWIVSVLAAVSVFVYHRFIRPRILREHAYRVTEVVPEAPGVWTVKLAPEAGEPLFDYLPGQFQFITFFRNRGLPEEEHHWTISSSPAGKDYVSSTIKALGDFTSTMGETRVGDRAAVHGGFGRFSYVLHPEERDLVFIAGGIGITPLMSMIRHMRDTRDTRRVLLLYANKDESGIVFSRELSEIEAGGYPSLRVVHVLGSPPPGWKGEAGFVDREKIQRLCGDKLDDKVFYVCGPPGLINAVLDALKALGVEDYRIRLEIFSFLD
ncbi:MAG: ferric reductase-like transmembrane domain-containing protein [Desulfomonilia bacterium]|jgi:predicted ferric reductase|uniref:Phenol hydroxylase P5 protein n=1 Tax=anaerobic digester metagenome TaxID=1263854 RepID=A0A485M8E6_9ZZZZ|nr:ferredoxin reductase family protein [Deltaproteobacteria bacterium]HRS55274.1 ferredoxin reductase family protein [Desulfomonilia bacterium]HRV35523.1 ferredoxin reductase family protein [Desulfomonilia bacterium]